MNPPPPGAVSPLVLKTIMVPALIDAVPEAELPEAEDVEMEIREVLAVQVAELVDGVTLHKVQVVEVPL